MVDDPKAPNAKPVAVPAKKASRSVRNTGPRLSERTSKSDGEFRIFDYLAEDGFKKAVDQEGEKLVVQGEKQAAKWLKSQPLWVQRLVKSVTAVGVGLYLAYQTIGFPGVSLSGRGTPPGSTTTTGVPATSTTVPGNRVGPKELQLPGTNTPVAPPSSTTIPPPASLQVQYDELCKKAPWGLVQPGDGAKGFAKDALNAAFFQYGAIIAGCAKPAQSQPGSHGWYQEGFDPTTGELMSVTAYSQSFPAHIAISDPATEADQLLHQGVFVDISKRESIDAGDVQMLWTSQGSILFSRFDENQVYQMLPAGAAEAWDEQSRQRNERLWPVQATPNPPDFPLVFNLVHDPLQQTASSTIQCADLDCGSYLVGADPVVHRARKRVINLNALLRLP